MDAIVERLLSEPGLTGVFLVITILVAWKLYRDLMKALADGAAATSKAEKDAYERLRVEKERQERHYREAMKEVNRSLEGMEKMVDRTLEFLARR